MIKKLGILLFAIGLLLTGLNVYGLSASLRSPALNGVMSPDAFYEQAKRAPNETDTQWAERMTMLVHEGIEHRWSSETLDEYNIIIPVWENWPIYLLKFAIPSLTHYEFIDPDKALERGVGLCSQQALALSGFLRQEGLDAGIIALNGHVVVGLNSGEGIVLDPDFGVVFKHSLAEIKANPTLLDQAYAAKDAPALKRIFSDQHTICPLGAEDYLPRRAWLEPVTYVIKWLIPILLMIPYALIRLKRENRLSP